MAGMDERFLDGAALREMLDQAIALEPAMGPVAHGALAAGLRRRRRRVTGIAVALAVVAAMAVTIPTLTRAHAAGPVTGTVRARYTSRITRMVRVAGTSRRSPRLPVKSPPSSRSERLPT